MFIRNTGDVISHTSEEPNNMSCMTCMGNILALHVYKREIEPPSLNPPKSPQISSEVKGLVAYVDACKKSEKNYKEFLTKTNLSK